MTVQPLDLRQRAGALAGRLPPLLADARHLAMTVMMGDHGRRRVGPGAEFWQFRSAVPGDAANRIDWRQSGKTEAHFIREREWQAAQTVTFWVDPGRSMGFTSQPKSFPTKHERAISLSLALAILLDRAGERIGLAGDRSGRGEGQLMRMAGTLSDLATEDYASPDLGGVPQRSLAVIVSDFFAPIEALTRQITTATDRGVRGALLQINDPAEETFPFSGRTVFESMGGTLHYEVQRAGSLKDDYRERLIRRRAELADLARATGWQMTTHHTDQPAQSALLWLYGAIGRQA